MLEPAGQIRWDAGEGRGRHGVGGGDAMEAARLEERRKWKRGATGSMEPPFLAPRRRRMRLRGREQEKPRRRCDV